MKKALVLFMGLFLFSGCATMIRGTSQQLQITSEPPGAKVSLSTGQSCLTPCQMKLKRNQSLLVRYEKEGCDIETVSVYPTLAGGGVILGGVIDYGTGAVYDLVPNPCHAMLKCQTTKAETKPGANPEAKPEVKAEAISEVKTEVKPETKVESKTP